MSTPAHPAAATPFAESTPLGLFGLAVGCAALLPIAFGVAVSPSALRTAAMFCFLFGAGGQLLAGLMALANKNALGGTMFTTFAFNWVMNGWALTGMAEGRLPDPSVILAVDSTFLVIFLVLTYAFGFHSKLLVLFLLDIDALYVARILRELTHAPVLSTVIAFATVGLMAIALWLAFALLVNPTAGRPVFAVPGPLFTATPSSPASAEPSGSASDAPSSAA
jgi:succinate-acetate transporter protein